MKTQTLLLAAAILASACTGTAQKTVDYTSYVNVKLGSGEHGHVFVGANVPFGFVQVGPTSIPEDWDWCSGYHISDSTCIGFSHLHLEGTGIGDLFDVTLMPVIGEVTYARGNEDDPNSGLWSYADRTKEIAEPGYYSVPLTRYGIVAEMTATKRVGIHRYTFPESAESAIVIDLQNGGCWDSPYDTHVETVGDKGFRGWRYSTGWANNQKVFFYGEFSKPYDNFTLNGPKGMFGRADFKTAEGEQILVKVALSNVSMDGAKANFEAELPGWDFEQVRSDARTAWNNELSRVHIETADTESRTIFYTALYHTMIHPSEYCDVDGSYRGADDKIHTNPDFVNHTVFSLWDTYRSAMPLFTILQPEREKDFVNTMLNIYKEQGRLPVWHLMGNETDCMVGNPGVIAVADAVVKGYDVDRKLAFEALKTTTMLDDRGQDLRKKYGFIPCDLYNEGLANDMEYAIADGAVAQAAKFLGDEQAYEFYLNRSHSYRNYMDPETQLARGRLSDGSWRTPFNPFVSNHREQDYCEGNAWQYTWLVPQDFDGLVEFYGSKENLVARLDTLFAQSTEIQGENASPDIAGMIGQYAHGNEPSHHIIYFYSMADAPAKTADKVREVYNTQYFNSPEGLAGNEDEGQMSAWYVLSSFGFFQVEPAVPRFWFGSPLWDKAEIKVAGGKFTIIAEGTSDTNRYIQSVTLNGKPYNKGYIEYADIVKGGTLTFKMGSEPALWY